MKLAILGSRGYPYVYSGYETFVADLSVRLVAKGHEVTVYCHRAFFTSKPSELNGVRLVYIPAIEKKILSQFSHSLLSTVHALTKRFDVVLYVNSANGPFGLLTKIAGMRTAINVDGLEWLRPKWKGMGGRYFRFASWLSTRLFDGIITDSTEMAHIYKREFNAESVVIEYGSNPSFGSSPELIRQFGVEKSGYYLIVGRLIPDNNVKLMVDGFVRSRTQKKLIVLGDVPYRDTYADSVRSVSDPRVIFPGYVRDHNVLTELYCNCFAYMHGHEFGGTNPSLLKALANGCAVLALDTVFSREVLSGEKHGRYFTKDPSTLIKSLELLESSPDLVDQLRRSARSRIEERYTWERITNEYEKFLSSLSKA